MTVSQLEGIDRRGAGVAGRVIDTWGEAGDNVTLNR